VGKPQFYPAVFDIDISVCMSCQICVEISPFEAIKMDKVFELSTRQRFDALLQRKDELSKSNTYYHSIHPVEAAEVVASWPKQRRKRSRQRQPRKRAGGCGKFPWELIGKCRSEFADCLPYGFAVNIRCDSRVKRTARTQP
jgi:NADH-quinone oxidoreductase subunit I